MRITKHASMRMQDRRISIPMIKEVISKGIRMVNKTDSSKFTFKHRTEQLYVVTDKEMTTLITVFWKEVK